MYKLRSPVRCCRSRGRGPAPPALSPPVLWARPECNPVLDQTEAWDGEELGHLYGGKKKKLGHSTPRHQDLEPVDAFLTAIALRDDLSVPVDDEKGVGVEQDLISLAASSRNFYPSVPEGFAVEHPGLPDRVLRFVLQETTRELHCGWTLDSLVRSSAAGSSL